MSVFAVSKVRMDASGQITEVLWGVVDTKSNRWVSPEVVMPVTEVIDVIRNGDHVVALFPTAYGHVPGPEFIIVENASGQRIELGGSPIPEREIHKIDKFDLQK